MFGQNFDFLNARFFRFRRRRSGGDPFREHLVIDRIDFEAFAAFVRNGAGGLEQHQAPAGIARNDAAAESAAGERQIIAFIIVTAQGKLETVLAGSGAVTGARAATGFGEHRLNMIAKAPLERFVHVLDRDFRRSRLSALQRHALLCHSPHGTATPFSILTMLRIAGNENGVGDLRRRIVCLEVFRQSAAACAA